METSVPVSIMSCVRHQTRLAARCPRWIRDAGFLVAVILITSHVPGCSFPSTSVRFAPSFVVPRRQLIAVLPFDDAFRESGTSGFVYWSTEQHNGDAVAWQLAESLVGTGLYRVLERSQLDKLLDELDLSAADIVKQKGIREIGRLLGSDALVLGTVHSFGQAAGLWLYADVSFGARCVDVGTGEVLWSASPSRIGFGNAHKFKRDLCDDVARQLQRRCRRMK